MIDINDFNRLQRIVEITDLYHIESNVWDTKKIGCYIVDKKLEIDPQLIALLLQLKIIDDRLIDVWEKHSVSDLISNVLKDYELSAYNNEFNLLGLYSISYCLYVELAEEGEKDFVVQYCKEVDKLIEFITNHDISSITFKAKKGVNHRVKQQMVITLLIEQLKAYLKNEQVSRGEYVYTKYKGKPKSFKRQALKGICRLISFYLTHKNELMPDEGDFMSDRRRHFLADFLKSLNLLPKTVSDKEYINSLFIDSQ